MTLRDSADPDYDGTGVAIFGLGVVFVLGLGLILLGVVVMFVMRDAGQPRSSRARRSTGTPRR